MDTNTAISEKEIKEIFEKQKIRSLVLRNSTFTERFEKLDRIKEWIITNTKKIHEAIYQDLKKPVPETDLTEIRVVLSEIRFAKSNLKDWMRPKEVQAPIALLGTRSFVHYEPKGVCLIISPWNFPFNLSLGPLVHALAAGNTAIIKPSEMTATTSALINEMISSLFNEDDVKVIEGDNKISQELLSLPFDHIFFTGSPSVGKLVMKAAADHLTSITLELGGKSPAVIDETADIKDSAEKIAWGKFLNNGQTCIAPDYLLVSEKMEDEMVRNLKFFTSEKFSENGEFKNSEAYGRIVNKGHLERLAGLLEDAVGKGARIEYGGNFDEKDLFFEPTIVTHVEADTLLMNEEIFGPILPVITYNNLTEAINFINQKPKPLAVYAFGKKKEHLYKILNATSSGSACINDCLIQFTHPGLPFGGVNNSGIGKSHGYHGFIAFSNEKPVLKQKRGFTTLNILYPPYKPWVRKISSFISKYV